MSTPPPHQPRFLVVTLPIHGHVNPSFQFAERLSAAAAGAQITFVTAATAQPIISKYSNRNPLISFSLFPHGYEDGISPELRFAETSRRGKQAIADLVSAAATDGRPYSCIVYSILLPWAGIIANELGLPSFLLWIQPATVFDIYYYYFHGYEHILRNDTGGGKTTLPGLSLEFTSCDVPSFMDSGDTVYSFVLGLLREQFEILETKTNSRVLVNTFDELESEALGAIDGVNLIGVGPLIPSVSQNDASAETWKDDKCIEWLNGKPIGSVIYVSFGSMSVLSKLQMEEVAKALLSVGRPFLWVNRETKDIDNEEAKLSCEEELNKLGLIVPWCGQVEVLSNPALGCFVTHCGWNSTLESLVAGVPLVGFPQWSDQGTNAKLIEEVWRTGVRVKVYGEDGIVKSEEFKRCLELVLEEEEFRSNALKWKCVAREAANSDGSSAKNLKAFVDDLIGQVGASGGQTEN